MKKIIPENKEIEHLLEFLSEHSTSLSRNDPCLCHSGKKYKHCCLNTETTSASSIRNESIEITTEPLTEEEAQHDFSKLEKADEDLKSSSFQIYFNNPEQIDSEDCKYLKILHELQKKYPNNPVILHYLSVGYHILKMADRTEEFILLSYEKCPNYLFAKIGRARLYLLNNEPQKALDVLGGFTLKQIYPNRSVFHITEMIAFALVLIQYFCQIENIKQAEIYLGRLEEILDQENPQLEAAQDYIWEAKKTQNIKIGLAKLERLRKKRK